MSDTVQIQTDSLKVPDQTPVPGSKTCLICRTLLEDTVRRLIRIEEALTGTSLHPHGIIHKIDSHSERLYALEQLKTTAKGAMWAFGISGGVLGCLGTLLVKHLFIKGP